MPTTPFQPNSVSIARPDQNDPEEAQSPDQMTATAQDVVDDQNQDQQDKKAQKVDPRIKKRNEEFRTRVDGCKIYRRKLIANWTVNIDYRRGKPFTSQTDEDQVAVNLDWALTKAKAASLFSQVPQARVNHGEDLLPATNPWALQFQKKLNETIIVSGVEAAMDECLPDCINAAGFGVVMVSYEALTEDREVSQADPSILPDSPTTPIPYILDHHYLIERISPADFLWPINFTGSNFDNAPWIGRSGRITWPQAVQQFGLEEGDKDLVLGEDRPMMDKLTHDVERDKTRADEMVGFDEVFFKEYCYDEEAKSYTSIHRLVFVNGKDDPVVDEPWKGQQVGPDGISVIGAQRFPIRVLTLTYITDEAIPPSDSAIGRPQVNEVNKARTQMIWQRERSLPIRWFDVNRLDPTIQQALMRGTWQTMIPVQGDGGRVIGEVARATMPNENFNFDRIAKNDLMQEWTLNPAQMGMSEGESKSQAGQEAAQASTQLTRERAKVASFFVSIAEVLGGLMCLFENSALFGQGFNPSISSTLRYSVLSDSTVLLDANQKLARLNQFINVYAKSGWVNLEPVLQEIAQLSGLDPAVVIKPPQPRPPVEPNISLRLTGVEDLLNPLSLAMLIKSGQAPPPQLIEQAKQLIQQSVVPPQGTQLQPGAPAPGGAPMLPAGAPLPPPVGAPPPGSPVPPPPPPKVGEAHPQLAVLPKINQRSESGGKQ